MVKAIVRRIKIKKPPMKRVKERRNKRKEEGEEAKVQRRDC